MNGDKLESLLFAYIPDNPGQLNPLALAYIGDAVHELYIRQYLISLPNHRPHHLHKQTTLYVSAKAQAQALKIWIPFLTDEESDIARRGRNAKSGTTAKNADVLEYRHSTGFECLVGYLYYKQHHDRLRYLLDLVTLKEKEV